MKNNPMQPLCIDDNGVMRFKENKLVKYLLDANGVIGMNELGVFAIHAGVSRTDQEQFAQLIGYSLSGFGELSYVRDKTYAKAEEKAEMLRKKQRTKEST
jgi:hypothetical protein